MVGLGPAGAAAARTCADAGCEVIAVDRKIQAGRPVQCAEYVPVSIGREVGVLGAALSQTISAMATFVEGETADIQDDFRGLMIDREAFDRQLVQAAERAGADCRFGTGITSVDRNGVVTISDGTRIQARVLIGADGPRSKVGAAIASINRELVLARQISLPLSCPYVATDIYLAKRYRGGYAWLFPKSDYANLGLGVSPKFRHELKPMLAELHAGLVREGRVGSEILATIGGAIPVGGLLRSHGMLADTAVVLCGDAAGLTDPITGAGINSAVLSGAMAGEGAVASVGNDACAGEDYHQELEELFGPALRRSLRHRRRLNQTYTVASGPSVADMRASWIAYPQYWAA